MYVSHSKSILSRTLTASHSVSLFRPKFPRPSLNRLIISPNRSVRCSIPFPITRSIFSNHGVVNTDVSSSRQKKWTIVVMERDRDRKITEDWSPVPLPSPTSTVAIVSLSMNYWEYWGSLGHWIGNRNSLYGSHWDRYSLSICASSLLITDIANRSTFSRKQSTSGLLSREIDSLCQALSPCRIWYRYRQRTTFSLCIHLFLALSANTIHL
jgi:hypothetical protein